MSGFRGLLTLLVVPLLATTQSPPLPDGDLDGLSYSPEWSISMTVFGQHYSWLVKDTDVEATPAWDTSSGAEPPFSLAQAIAASKPELDRYFPEVGEWVLDTVTLDRLGWSDHWFYVVEWRAKRNHEGDHLRIPVLMSGEVVRLKKEK